MEYSGLSYRLILTLIILFLVEYSSIPDWVVLALDLVFVKRARVSDWVLLALIVIECSSLPNWFLLPLLFLERSGLPNWFLLPLLVVVKPASVPDRILLAFLVFFQ